VALDVVQGFTNGRTVEVARLEFPSDALPRCGINDLEMVDQNRASWNLIRSFLQRTETLRRAA